MASESPPSADEDGATPQRPAPILLSDSVAPTGMLEGTPLLASHHPFDPVTVKEKDTASKSFLMFTLGFFVPFLVLISVISIGGALDQVQREEGQDQDQYVFANPDPNELTFFSNETGGYAVTIDLPETHEVSQCSLDINGEPNNRYDLSNEWIMCSTSNPSFPDIAGDEMLIWQLVPFSPAASKTTNLVYAEYSFQTKELSVSFDNNFSENPMLDAFILNEQNQFTKTSTQGDTVDGQNYTFQIQTNSTDEFYMEMNLLESSYHFSAEACDSCSYEQFPYLDNVQFYRITEWVEIGHYDSEINSLSFDPLPVFDGSEFPSQLEFDFSIDWAPVSITEETIWSPRSQSYGYQNSIIEMNTSNNGTYEFELHITDEVNWQPRLDCLVDSSSWPEYYDSLQRYPIYCVDTEVTGGYDSRIYQDSTFEIEEYVSILNQSWDPENREFFVEFNRTLKVQENDFSGTAFNSYPFRERPDSVGERNNFTVTFEESDGERDWISFEMNFQIIDNTSVRSGGHDFSWFVCEDCEHNLSEPTYRGILTQTDLIGGFNSSNGTLWFQPVDPTPPTVEMSIVLVPNNALPRSSYFDYGQYLYGEDYLWTDSESYDYSNPSDDFYFYSFTVSPFVYVGAISYSFVKGNKAFGKGLIASIVASLVLFGGIMLLFVLFLFGL